MTSKYTCGTCHLPVEFCNNMWLHDDKGSTCAPSKINISTCCTGINDSHTAECTTHPERLTCWCCGGTFPAGWCALWSANGSRCMRCAGCKSECRTCVGKPLDKLHHPEQPTVRKEQFTNEQVKMAIDSFLTFGNETLFTAHQGYFSDGGWAHRCLSAHRKELDRHGKAFETCVVGTTPLNEKFVDYTVGLNYIHGDDAPVKGCSCSECQAKRQRVPTAYSCPFCIGVTEGTHKALAEHLLSCAKFLDVVRELPLHKVLALFDIMQRQTINRIGG